jgi:hypothetical protein
MRKKLLVSTLVLISLFNLFVLYNVSSNKQLAEEDPPKVFIIHRIC